MKRQWSLILVLIFALITAVFAVINVNQVEVNLLFGKVQLPLILLILGSTLLGGLIVGFCGIFLQFRLQRKLKHTEAELEQLKAMAERANQPPNLPKFKHIGDEPATASSTVTDGQLHTTKE